MVNYKIFYSQTIKQPLPSIKCFTSKLIKYKTFYTSLSHNSPPPPSLSLSLSLSSITTHLPSHSQVLSSYKRKPPSHSSLSNSSAPLISHTTHCWLNLNHCQLQPPIINLIFFFFFFFFFQSNHSIHYPQSPAPPPPPLSSTHPLILKSVFFYHYVGLSIWVFGLWWVASS